MPSPKDTMPHAPSISIAVSYEIKRSTINRPNYGYIQKSASTVKVTIESGPTSFVKESIFENISTMADARIRMYQEMRSWTENFVRALDSGLIKPANIVIRGPEEELVANVEFDGKDANIKTFKVEVVAVNSIHDAEIAAKNAIKILIGEVSTYFQRAV